MYLLNQTYELEKTNTWVKKIWSNRSNDTLLRFVQVFLNQTLVCTHIKMNMQLCISILVRLSMAVDKKLIRQASDFFYCPCCNFGGGATHLNQVSSGHGQTGLSRRLGGSRTIWARTRRSHTICLTRGRLGRRCGPTHWLNGRHSCLWTPAGSQASW